MGENSAITWTHHTFNPWWGCQRVSPGCTNCYAERTGNRFDVQWGPTAARRFFGDKHWNEPIVWNRKALAAGERHRVFCASMSDVFEARPELVPHRARLWDLIVATPGLDWLLLTKRPENLAAMLPWSERTCPVCRGTTRHSREPSGVCMQCDRGTITEDPFDNVWIGVTAEDNLRAEERIPMLRATPARVRFVSCEPILEHIGADTWDLVLSPRPGLGPIHWLILGDESGPGARPAEVEWFRTAIRAARRHGVRVHVKQWAGELQPGIGHDLGEDRGRRKIHLPLIDGRRYAEFPLLDE